MIGGIDNRPGGHLGLIDRRNRLGLPWQPGQHPGELRRVHRRHLHHGHVDVALLVEQLTAQRLVEALNGVFGPAVGRLQRDAPISERRTDLHDRPAITGLHVPKGRHGAVDEAQVADLGDPRTPPALSR